MSECWNIISAGRSALQAKNEHMLNGPVVFVNRAIELHERIPGDFWAHWDKPDDASKPWMVHGHESGLPVWTGYPDDWGEWPSEVSYLRGGLVQDPEDPKGEMRAAPTLLAAIEEAAARGAKLIRVFGADMGGAYRGLYKLRDIEDVEGHDEARRWGFERRIWSQMTSAHWHYGGVAIERFMDGKIDTSIPMALEPPPRVDPDVVLLTLKDREGRRFALPLNREEAETLRGQEAEGGC